MSRRRAPARGARASGSSRCSTGGRPSSTRTCRSCSRDWRTTSRRPAEQAHAAAAPSPSVLQRRRRGYVPAHAPSPRRRRHRGAHAVRRPPPPRPGSGRRSRPTRPRPSRRWTTAPRTSSSTRRPTGRSSRTASVQLSVPGVTFTGIELNPSGTVGPRDGEQRRALPLQRHDLDPRQPREHDVQPPVPRARGIVPAELHADREPHRRLVEGRHDRLRLRRRPRRRAEDHQRRDDGTWLDVSRQNDGTCFADSGFERDLLRRRDRQGHRPGVRRHRQLRRAPLQQRRVSPARRPCATTPRSTASTRR